MNVQFDGDLLVYRAGFAAEKMHYYLINEEEGDEVAKHFQYKKDLLAYLKAHDLEEADVTIDARREVEPVKNALYNVKSLIKNALDSLGATEDDLTVFLSGPTNFRDGIATLKPYKANRNKQHKPVHGPAIKKFMEKKYDVIYSVDEEADDIVAYTHYALWKDDPLSSVIVTVDKDLNMIPGLHYNFVKDNAYNVTEAEAEYNFLTQLLMGDSTDNIPGVPGIGAKKAEEWLSMCADELAMWETVKMLYVQHYEDGWYDALVENGRLLWMRREANEWWNPPEYLQE